MSDLVVDREKTCAVTGHRRLEKDFDRERLYEIFDKLSDGNFNTFLVGMAIGFDTECFLALEKLRKRKKIAIIACVPCENQASRFSDKDKENYCKMLNSADDKVLISKEYTKFCMMKRNIYMVDNCSCLVSYLRQNSGGTKNTVDYAKKKGIPIIEL